jgi:sRNA-binding regulator protein Hfq
MTTHEAPPRSGGLKKPQHLAGKGAGIKGKPGPKKPDPRLKALAERISTESGIPLADARKVASGKETLADVLRRLRLKEEVARAAENQLLLTKFVGQVLAGRISLEEGLSFSRLHKRKNSPDYGRCHLADSKYQQQEVTLALVGRTLVTGTVKQESAFELVVTTREGESVQVSKHNVKFFFAAEDKKVLLKNMERRPDVPPVETDFLAHRRNRKDYKAVGLLAREDRKQTTQWTTVEGEVLRGTVEWFGRFEIRFKTTRGAEVILMRHALGFVE